MLWWGIAVVALLIGASGALIYGFWGVGQECHTWVDSRGYQLEHFDWWAKNRGCVAKTPGGDEILHSIDLGGKAKVWVWQFAIFTVGMSPAIVMVALTVRRGDGP
jgi:hypothetical protein